MRSVTMLVKQDSTPQPSIGAWTCAAGCTGVNMSLKRRIVPALAMTLAIGHLTSAQSPFAQGPTPQGTTAPAPAAARIRGKIESVTADKMTVTTRTGREVAI